MKVLNDILLLINASKRRENVSLIENFLNALGKPDLLFE